MLQFLSDFKIDVVVFSQLSYCLSFSLERSFREVQNFLLLSKKTKRIQDLNLIEEGVNFNQINLTCVNRNLL